MDLVSVGMKEDRWGITKNGLGIPPYKSAIGRGLYHVDGEDFYRGYDVSSTRQFNGSGYDPVSTVRPQSPITIFKK